MRAIICIFIFSLSIVSIQAGTVGDFDGDGRTDITVIRSSLGQRFWHTLKSSDNGYGYNVFGSFMGNVFDEPIIGDVDGDGKSDYIIWRYNSSTNEQAYFWIMKSSDSSIEVIPWGLGRDRPVVQDYDGDGKDDLAVFRREDSNFYVIKSSGGILFKFTGIFGIGTAIVGDYDGDGKGDFTVAYAADINQFNRVYKIIRSSDDQIQTVQFGGLNDFLVPGDYDGDGKTDIAIWRGRDTLQGFWYWIRSSDGQLDSVRFGTGAPSNDFAAPGDYDGDGITDIAIYRRGSQNYFWILGSQSGLQVIPWGRTSDIALMERIGYY